MSYAFARLQNPETLTYVRELRDGRVVALEQLLNPRAVKHLEVRFAAHVRRKPLHGRLVKPPNHVVRVDRAAAARDEHGPRIADDGARAESRPMVGGRE